MLQHFKKGWKNTVISRPQRTFWQRNNQQKPNWKMVQEVEIWRYQSRRRRKRLTFKFRWPGTYGSRERGRKLNNENISRRLHYRLFDPTQKARKNMEIGWMGHHEVTDNKAKHVPIFTDLRQRNEQIRFWRIVVYLQKCQEKDGLRFARCYIQTNTETCTL